MGKGFFVKFEDEYGNSRTIYANANNEYEAKMIALSKAQNCINHRNAFEAFCGNTMISNIYQKRMFTIMNIWILTSILGNNKL